MFHGISLVAKPRRPILGLQQPGMLLNFQTAMWEGPTHQRIGGINAGYELR